MKKSPCREISKDASFGVGTVLVVGRSNLGNPRPQGDVILGAVVYGTPTKVIIDGLKRNVSRGNSLSDELELSSVLGDRRAYLYSPV